MLTPILISSVFVLAVVVLCFYRPNTGRIFLGIFFLIMAFGVNGSFTFSNPQAYVEYASSALIPGYRELALAIVQLNPKIFGALLMVYEVAMGLLLLHRGNAVKVGLIGTMVFLLGIAPLSYLQIPWLGLIIGEMYLFGKDFDRSFLQMLQNRFRRSKAAG
jgi:hypothetical protein